jgi:2-oxoglutarate ferredoxin oxidoreductase subunit delta
MKYWRKTLDQDQVKPARGQVEIIIDRCKGCGFCIEFCPKQVLAESKEFNRKGYHPVYVAHPDECVDCGLCELICPEFAVTVTPVESETDKEGTAKKEGQNG